MNDRAQGGIRWLGICMSAVLAVPGLLMAVTPAAGADLGKRCADPAFRQFDFWIGTWSVTQGGKHVGRNTIEGILDGCALLESWASDSGVRGHSLNTYDAARGVWHQTWVDNGGGLLLLEGTLHGRAMILDGIIVDPVTRQQVAQRVTWTWNSDGTVRQLWQSSADGGRSWAIEFDGLYGKPDN